MKKQKCRAIHIVTVSKNIINGYPLLSSLFKAREKNSYSKYLEIEMCHTDEKIV